MFNNKCSNGIKGWKWLLLWHNAILLNYVLLEAVAVRLKQSIISQVDCTFTRKKAGSIIIAKCLQWDVTFLKAPHYRPYYDSLSPFLHLSDALCTCIEWWVSLPVSLPHWCYSIISDHYESLLPPPLYPVGKKIVEIKKNIICRNFNWEGSTPPIPVAWFRRL
jgi:hypothetical protein